MMAGTWRAHLNDQVRTGKVCKGTLSLCLLLIAGPARVSGIVKSYTPRYCGPFCGRLGCCQREGSRVRRCVGSIDIRVDAS